MGLGSFARGALAEIDASDVERMLELDETLFVEHKRELGGEDFQLSKAVAAFANTLGGWVLVGIVDGAPYGSEESWARDDGVNLVDAVRDRLRDVLDPLPAFEARRFDLAGGPVGVIRVYESADTPHVHLRSGAVYVRESAGDFNAAKRRQSASDATGDRAYRVSVIRSRAQLVQLAERSRLAEERVRDLVDPHRRLPLVEQGLGLRWNKVAHRDPDDGGGIFVRLMPYTLPARFRDWSTTTHAAAAVLGAVEQLSGLNGLNFNWVIPHPAGAHVSMGYGHASPRHTDGAGFGLRHGVRVMVDGVGMVGAAMVLESPAEDRRTWIDADALAAKFIAPTIDAAAQVLREAEALGRAFCQIDLPNLRLAVKVEHSGDSHDPVVSRSVDIAVPVTEEEVARAATLAAYAFARGSGAPMYDPPSGPH